MSKYDRKYYLRQTQRGWLRKQHLIEIKGGGCKLCGYNRCSRSLHFHHINPKEKSFQLDLRNIGNKKWADILAEADKCDLLCGNCHNEVHDAETNKEYIEYEMIHRGSQIKICLNCGKDFKVFDSVVDKGEGKYCSRKCSDVQRRKIQHPTKIELSQLLWEKPTTKIAKDFGVSDKAVEKWAKSHGLTKPPRGYWAKNRMSSNGKMQL